MKVSGYDIVSLAAIPGTVFFVVDWCAHFGHHPGSYQPLIAWPWPPGFCGRNGGFIFGRRSWIDLRRNAEKKGE